MKMEKNEEGKCEEPKKPEEWKHLSPLTTFALLQISFNNFLQIDPIQSNWVHAFWYESGFEVTDCNFLIKYLLC
jgi:hypothetical protein